MFQHMAEPEEEDVLRRVWGPTVTEVTFWDADFPEEAIEATGSRWELAEAFAHTGRLWSLRPGDAGWEHLEPMLRARGETVKFGLRIA